MKGIDFFSNKPEYIPTLEPSDEEEIEDLLNQFPIELRTEWEHKILHLDGKRSKNVLNVALQERKKALDKNDGHISGDPSIKEEIDIVVQEIEALSHLNLNVLGEGNFGCVYQSPHSEKVCIKFLTDQVQTEFHEKVIEKEAQYLKSMYQFVVDGVRTPYAYFKGTKKYPYYIGMEKINGKSLFAIMEDKDNNQELVDVIKRQKKEDVILRIKNFLEQMYIVKKIVHKDVHPGNIMIDTEGNWYVIDFGLSREREFGDESQELHADDIKHLKETIEELYAKI